MRGQMHVADAIWPNLDEADGFVNSNVLYSVVTTKERRDAYGTKLV